MPIGRCPCSSGLTYDECCGPVHRAERAAPTAEALMRSRYSAFALGDVAHLLRTWARATRPADLVLDPDVRWRGLEVLATERGGPFDDVGTVAFRASYRSSDGPGVQSEVSRFVREDGRWVYLDALS